MNIVPISTRVELAITEHSHEENRVLARLDNGPWRTTPFDNMARATRYFNKKPSVVQAFLEITEEEE